LTDEGRLFTIIQENNEESPNLSVKLGDIKLSNPVIMCSGTFGYGEEYSEFYDTSLLGAVTTKPPPALCSETARA